MIALEQAVRQAREAYVQAAAALGAARRDGRGQAGPGGGEGTAAAAAGQGALPRRGGRAGRSATGGPAGTDLVRFLIATNPGQELGPAGTDRLGRRAVAADAGAEGGVVIRLAGADLVFDEVDADVGGATAAAVGERLTRVAERVQVLVVTHSPQVAARGGAHLLVSKQAARGRTATRVDQLDAPAAARGDRAHAGRRDGHRGRPRRGR